MYVMKRAVRVDLSRVGDIIPLSRLRTPVQLIPMCGQKADTRLTSRNSSQYTLEFFLNKYWDKEAFESIY